MRANLPHVIVFGTRTFDDYELLLAKLDHYCSDLGKVVVVNGACPTGADALSERWAFQRGHMVMRFEPEWSLGKKAGPLRNRDMVNHVLGVEDRFAIAFYDGSSPGTTDMIARVRAAKIDLRIIRF